MLTLKVLPYSLVDKMLPAQQLAKYQSYSNLETVLVAQDDDYELQWYS
jgi:hypothetical protein